MTVERMLDEISSMELTEWTAYFQLMHMGEDPEERADVRSAILGATLANRLGTPALKPDDLMPKFTTKEDNERDFYQGMMGLVNQRGAPLVNTSRAVRQPRNAPGGLREGS